MDRDTVTRVCNGMSSSLYEGGNSVPCNNLGRVGNNLLNAGNKEMALKRYKTSWERSLIFFSFFIELPYRKIDPAKN